MDIQANLTANELRKAALLITKAADLEMDVGGYGETAVNNSNGNVYLWLEDYPFSLFIPLGGSDRIHACWSDPYFGDEETIDAHDLTLHDLEAWAEALTEATETASVD